MAEKLRRKEIDKFDFHGQLSFLRRVQRACEPKIRNVVLQLINVVNKPER